jgi:hypothetical protein
METIKQKLGLFLGVTLFTQAVTSLLGGVIFLNPFNTLDIGDGFIQMLAASTGTAYISIVLQIVTAMVIIMLGAALYHAAGRRNKTAATVALCLYAAEAVLLLAGQAFVYGMLQAAQLYAASGDAQLIAVTNILYSCRQFCGEIAMVPFGIGALIFYSQITAEKIIPKWLGWYGMVTVLAILFGVPLGTFGVTVPFWIMALYVPFEFAAGGYITVKSLLLKNAAA